ncbi:hypothetical protein RJ639_003810 [Escallonia herrerae]|uniref:Uncharacterized protein n=1 Tax=Escallonia herrerae TaxID=1293975 RepID=A0AA88W1Z5_9ASTE|nr:hypothetical protein RJ639_003810 [Escallonia herrerae]
MPLEVQSVTQHKSSNDTHVSVLGITRAEEPHFKASTRGNYGVAVFDGMNCSYGVCCLADRFSDGK